MDKLIAMINIIGKPTNKEMALGTRDLSQILLQFHCNFILEAVKDTLVKDEEMYFQYLEITLHEAGKIPTCFLDIALNTPLGNGPIARLDFLNNTFCWNDPPNYITSLKKTSDFRHAFIGAVEQILPGHTNTSHWKKDVRWWRN